MMDFVPSVFDSNGKRPDGMMSMFAYMCLALSHISQDPCPPVFYDLNGPAGHVHSEGKINVSNKTVLLNIFIR